MRTGGASIETRCATMRDAPLLTAILHESFAPLESQLGYPPSPMTRDYRGLVADNFVLLAQISGAPEYVGAAVLAPRLGHLYLEAIGVRPSAQRRGVGSALMAQVEAFCGELCAPRLRLHTCPYLPDLVRFYSRLEYQELARFGEGPHGRVVFEKRVPTQLDRLLAERRG